MKTIRNGFYRGLGEKDVDARDLTFGCGVPNKSLNFELHQHKRIYGLHKHRNDRPSSKGSTDHDCEARMEYYHDVIRETH